MATVRPTQPQTSEPAPYRCREIAWRQCRLVLRDELSCPVTQEGGLFIISCEPLAIRAYAPTWEQAVAGFNEEFCVLWQEIGQADEAALAPDALALKQRLQRLVARATAG